MYIYTSKNNAVKYALNNITSEHTKWGLLISNKTPTVK